MSKLLGLPPGKLQGKEAPSSSTFRDPKKEVVRLPAALPGRQARAPERADRAPSPPRRPERAHGRGAPLPAPARPRSTHRARASRPAPTTGSAGGPGLQSEPRLRRSLPSCSRRSVRPGSPQRSARRSQTPQLRVPGTSARTAPRHCSPLPAPSGHPPAHRPAPAPVPAPLPAHWSSGQPVKGTIGQLESPPAPPRAKPRPRGPTLGVSVRRTLVLRLCSRPTLILPAWLALGCPPARRRQGLPSSLGVSPTVLFIFLPVVIFQVLISSLTRICLDTPGWGRG